MKPETEVVHAGEENFHLEGAVAPPIFQTANYLSSGETDYHRVRYIRLNNTPNHQILHEKLARLEGAEAALVTASGMGAISTALLTILKPGDHLLIQECIYGGTLTFVLRDLKEMEVSHSWIDVAAPNSWEKLVTPKTKAIYVESIGNPLTQVGALDTVPAFAKKHGLVSLIDNTIPSPLRFQPIKHGFDVSLHSATKYLNGHSDIVAGAVIGSADRVDKIKHKLDHLGAALDPHACFLLNRGMKTLALRMNQHEANALSLARFLEKHPKVEKVYYPGLESHPDHSRAKALLSGFSGLFSFEMKGGVQDADAFLSRLKIPLVAASLGGVETLITRPATTSHRGLTDEERSKIGVKEKLIRVSVGIEHTQDLIDDFAQALK